MTGEVGLIETIRIRNRSAPLWPLHRARLVRSAGVLGIPLPPGLDPPAGGDDRVVRLLLDSTGISWSERAVGPTASLTLVTSSEPHPGYPHKITDREPFERATAAARAARGDDGILLVRGTVGEAGNWTLLWWEGERLAGPPLASGILDSVSRARLAQVAGGIAERELGPADLRGVALVAANAARGLVSVRSVDGCPVPQSPRTRALQERFWP